MKILIWVHKDEVISNKILKCHFTRPYIDRHDDYVQVEITHDEFIRLEDNKKPYTQSTEALIARHKTKLSSEQMKIEKPSHGKLGGNLQDAHMRETSVSLPITDWLVEQYNRNREQTDWVKNRSEIPYIYERTGEDVYRRREGDTERELMTNDEFHASNKPIKKTLKILLTELQTIPGAKFESWWKGLTKEEQIELTKFWE